MANLKRSCLGSDHDGAAGLWLYSRPTSSGIVELATVRGQDVALPIHFHDEDQITFVVSGHRHFVVGGELVVIGKDEGVRIPASVPHESLARDSDVLCINIYTFPDACSAPELLCALGTLRRRKGTIGSSDLATLVGEHQCAARLQSRGMDHETWQTVSEAAQRSGMTREGFSRRFRRAHGLPPRTFHVLQKLNLARHLLRSGWPIAEVAMAAGFADQSHLGRLFRRAFGTTPGRYIVGIRSQSF